MPGRPLYPLTQSTYLGQIGNRVDALERRRDVTGFYEIKVFADDETVILGDGAFIFAIPYDLSGGKLRSINAFVTTAGGADLVVMIHNVTHIGPNLDLLTTPITIDAGTLDADQSATLAEIDTTVGDVYAYPHPNNRVLNRDQIRIDVDADGGGAMGLGFG
jgi:hypothetical protein